MDDAFPEYEKPSLSVEHTKEFAVGILEIV
jgi:hypothetical protein